MAELTHDEDGFHEIQLSGKQIVFLFMATTVVLVSIFLCGVMVGRGVRAQQIDEPLDVVATNGATAPAEAAGAPEEPLPPTKDLPNAYDPILRGGDKPPAEPSLKQRPDPPQSVSAPPPPPATAKPIDEPRPDVSVPTAGRPGQWVIQLTAVKNRASATQIVKRLIDKGHPAYLQNPAPRDPMAIYRVRVGGFKDRREAESLAQRLQKEEQFSPVVTTR
jgi:cell division septation protein DedD